MKRQCLYLAIFVIFGLFLYGCTPEEPIEDPAPIEEPQPIDEPSNNGDEEEVIIAPKEKVDVSNLTLLDEYSFDFDKDGSDENIAMYTAAGRDSNGEIAWDDGQDWLFVVQDTEKDYVLLDEYVQLGSVDFYIFMVDDDFYIATISARTASLELNSYKYDRENDGFIKTVPFSASGNVNMIKVSTR